MKRNTFSISSPAEEYLLTLFRLEYNGQKTGTNQLAKLFGVKAPSVTGMLRRLNQGGWVRYRRYRPPELTDQGRAFAVRLIRRHRLLETFLVRFLDYDPAEVHDEVKVLEHTVSDDLLRHIDNKLGHPAYDPHGDPIPDEEGNVPKLNMIPLSQLEVGGKAIFQRVDNRDDEVLLNLEQIGGRQGITVVKVAAIGGGSFIFRIGGDEKEICLDSEIADLIWVTPYEPTVSLSSPHNPNRRLRH